MALPPQQFCVRWNSYHTNLQSWFPRLLMSEQFADVTLACESRQLRCHKIVLSACSAYLERLLSQNPCKHPIVLMRDMRFSEMQALVDFMYKGEVNVTQEELPSLLKSAEALQIRGLCSSESSSASPEAAQTKDFAVASDALLANVQRPGDQGNGPTPQKTPSPTPNGTKKKESSPDVKEETVEEDGLYYGELDNDHMEFNEDEETGKPGSSIGQSSEYPIANVQCQYDSPSDTDAEERAVDGGGDHTYGRLESTDEPPAFVIQQTKMLPTEGNAHIANLVPIAPKIMTIAPGYPSLNLIQVVKQTDQANVMPTSLLQTNQSQPEFNISKRIRRSEGVLRAAAECVSRGLTFQTVSEQFNIPISTIRFFMARKGILPRRRRGRSTLMPSRTSASPEPPFHMQHYKLPNMVALTAEDDEQPETG